MKLYFGKNLCQLRVLDILRVLYTTIFIRGSHLNLNFFIFRFISLEISMYPSIGTFLGEFSLESQKTHYDSLISRWNQKVVKWKGKILSNDNHNLLFQLSYQSYKINNCINVIVPDNSLDDTPSVSSKEDYLCLRIEFSGLVYLFFKYIQNLHY